MKIFLVVTVLFLNACNPFIMFRPPSLKSLKAHQKPGGGNIEVAIDRYGIPFIKANNTRELMYGLGFMHARDRLFQVDLLRHASLGRISEFFGERGLAYDRKLRILTYRLDEQMERLSEEENQLLDSYVNGVNDGAKYRGRSAEHFLLGIQFEPFSKRDVIAIARFQSWQLAADLFSEITRLKIARSDWSMDAKAEMLAPMNDQKSAIIVDHVQAHKPEKLVMPNYLKRPLSQKGSSLNLEQDKLLPTSQGASNSWVIDAKKSSDGHAMVMNDPHLIHAWPSNFYLATLLAGDFFVAGASVPGLPGIIIGSTKNLAWGVTAALLNTQDSVLLEPDEKDKNFYIVDGKRIPFEKWPQQFCMNKKKNCLTEVHKLSIFGPVLTHKFDKWIDKGDMVAVQWTGFSVEQHAGISAGFIELAKAKNVFEAIKVVKTMTLPGVNLVLADIAGNIAYAYAGLVPKRDPAQNPYLPLDGSLIASRWPGFLKQGFEPSAINPETGFIVNANQNIFGLTAHADLYFGKLGAPPFRAMRIKDRIEESLKKSGKVTFDDLSEIQLDDTSLEAKELAPLIGAKCLLHFDNADGNRKSFAKEVAKFDGRYTTASLGALPYENLVWETVTLGLKSALGEHLPEWITYTGQATYVVKDALLQELRGKSSPIFAKPTLGFQSFDNLVGEACEKAYQKIVKKAGSSPWKWRWGRHHYLQRQSPLAAAPLIGGWFKDKKREVAGITNAPMAESGLPVVYGANVRFRVKLTNPPEIHAVLDSGNSGTVGQENAFDQAKLWHEGKTILLETEWNKALLNAIAKFHLDG